MSTLIASFSFDDCFSVLLTFLLVVFPRTRLWLFFLSQRHFRNPQFDHSHDSLKWSNKSGDETETFRFNLKSDLIHIEQQTKEKNEISRRWWLSRVSNDIDRYFSELPTLNNSKQIKKLPSRVFNCKFLLWVLHRQADARSRLVDGGSLLRQNSTSHRHRERPFSTDMNEWEGEELVPCSCLCLTIAIPLLTFALCQLRSSTCRAFGTTTSRRRCVRELEVFH